MAEGQEGWLGKLANLIKPRHKAETTTPTPTAPETPVSGTPTAEAPMSPTASPTTAPTPTPTKA